MPATDPGETRVVHSSVREDVNRHPAPIIARFPTASIDDDLIRTGVLAAIETSLASADKATTLLLSSGFTVSVEAERVLKQRALTYATNKDDSKEEVAQLTALLHKFSIHTKAKKSNTMLAEMRRACVTRGINISGEALRGNIKVLD